MQEGAILEWAKNIGVPGVIFLIWYLYHKAQSGILMKLIEEHTARDNKNFEVLNRYAETLEYHASCLARMEAKIDNNQFCPVARKEDGK
jgi:hypothetical protein